MVHHHYVTVHHAHTVKHSQKPILSKMCFEISCYQLFCMTWIFVGSGNIIFVDGLHPKLVKRPKFKGTVKISWNQLIFMTQILVRGGAIILCCKIAAKVRQEPRICTKESKSADISWYQLIFMNYILVSGGTVIYVERLHPKLVKSPEFVKTVKISWNQLKSAEFHWINIHLCENHHFWDIFVVNCRGQLLIEFKPIPPIVTRGIWVLDWGLDPWLCL